MVLRQGEGVGLMSADAPHVGATALLLVQYGMIDLLEGGMPRIGRGEMAD